MVEGVVHQEGSELPWGLAVWQVEEDFHRVKVVVGVQAEDPQEVGLAVEDVKEGLS